MRRLRWLALAALLLAAGTALLSLGSGEPAPPARTQVEFPRWMRPPERQRSQRRATLDLPPPATPPDAPPGGEPPGPPPRRDPFLVALPVKPDAPVVVFEANALRHSRLGELFVACIQATDAEALRSFERESGIDPLKDVDRVAFLGDAVVISGFFDRVRWDQASAPEPYGDAGRIYRDGGLTVGSWRDQILVLSERPEDVQAAIDQLEGRAPVPESGIPEEMAYGEVYGVIPGAAAKALLGAGDAALGARLAALARRVELHVDAMQDVAAVVRVAGDDRQGLSDLARSLGAAMAVARVKAQATRDQKLAELLEHAEVMPGSEGFSLQVALPAALLERWFEGCGAREPHPAR